MDFKFDYEGRVIQTNGDGGDSPARTSLYWFLFHLLYPKTLLDASWLPKFQISLGVFYRYPVTYPDPKDIPADQENPIVMVLGWYVERYGTGIYLLKTMLWNRIKRFSRFQNGNPSGPQDYGMLFRSLHWWWMYPFLLPGDFLTLINSLIICFWKARAPGPILTWLGKYHWFFVADSPPNVNGVPQDVHGWSNVGSDINHCMSLIQNYKIYPTPVSYLARIIYVKARPGGVQQAWNVYFDSSTGANPFNELARPIIKEILS